MDNVIEYNHNSRDFNVLTGFKANLIKEKSIVKSKIEKILNHAEVV